MITRKLRQNDDAEMALAPMVDVVFQLLVFFIFAYQIRIMEQFYWVRVPESSPAARSDDAPPLRVRLEAGTDGALAGIVVDDRLWSTWAEFEAALADRPAAGGEARSALLQSAAGLKYRHVVRAALALQQRGWTVSLLEAVSSGTSGESSAAHHPPRERGPWNVAKSGR